MQVVGIILLLAVVETTITTITITTRRLISPVVEEEDRHYRYRMLWPWRGVGGKSFFFLVGFVGC